jgi:hypothetical protein
MSGCKGGRCNFESGQGLGLITWIFLWVCIIKSCSIDSKVDQIKYKINEGGIKCQKKVTYSNSTN